MSKYSYKLAAEKMIRSIERLVAYQLAHNFAINDFNNLLA